TLCLFCLFFFSSRRRHTRWPRDWSSDVCSSDLGDLGRGVDAQPDEVVLLDELVELRVGGAGEVSPVVVRREIQWRWHLRSRVIRSEERRVGKECRSRWWT